MPRKYKKKEPKCTDDQIINLAAAEVINEKKSVLQTARKYNITQVALRKRVRLIRGHRKRFTYSHETLQAAVRHLSEKNHSLSWVSKHYGIPRSTLSARLKSDCPFERKVTGKGTALPKGEEEAIKKWILETGKKEGTQAWQTIAKTVQEVLNERGLKVFKNNNKPTSGWLQAFLRRHPELRKIRIGYWTTGIVGEANRDEEGLNHHEVKVVIPKFDENDEEMSDLDFEEEEELESPKHTAKEEIQIKTETLNSPSSEQDAKPVEVQLSPSRKTTVHLKSKVDHLKGYKENKSGAKFRKLEPKISQSGADPHAIGTNITISDSSKLSVLKDGRIVVAPTAGGEASGASKGTVGMLLGIRKITVGRKGVAVNGETVEAGGNDRLERQVRIGKENVGVGGKGCEKGSNGLKVTAGGSEVEVGSVGMPGGKMKLGVTAMDVNTADGKSIKILLKGFKKPDSSGEQDKSLFKCSDEKVVKFLLVANPKGSSISKTRLVLPKDAKNSPILVPVVQKVTHPQKEGVPQNVNNMSKEKESTEYLNKTPLVGTESSDKAPLAHIEDPKKTPESPIKIPVDHSQDSNKTNFNDGEKQMSSKSNPEDSNLILVPQEPDNSSCVQPSPPKMVNETDHSLEDTDLLRDLEACAFHVQEPETPTVVEKLPKTNRIELKGLSLTDAGKRKRTVSRNENTSSSSKKPRIRVKTVSSLMTATDTGTSDVPKHIEEPLTDPLSVLNDTQQKHSPQYIEGLEDMYNVIMEEIGMDKLLQWSREGGQPDDPLFRMFERSRAVLAEAKRPLTPTDNLLPKNDALVPIMEVDETEAKYMYVPDLRESSNGPLGREEELSCQMSEEEYMLLQESMWEEDVKPEIEDIKPLPELEVEKMEPQAVASHLVHHSSTTEDEGEVRLSSRQKRKIKSKCPCCT